MTGMWGDTLTATKMALLQREAERHIRDQQADIMRLMQQAQVRPRRTDTWGDNLITGWDLAEDTEGNPRNVVIPDKPLPIEGFKFEPLPDLKAYDEVAQVLGFQPAELQKNKIELQRRELIEFLLDKGFPMYGNDRVHDYMKALAQKDGKRFVWKHMTEAKRGGVGREDRHGEFVAGPYKKAIPLFALKRAAEIKKKFGDEAQFYVSDYEVVRPDPFLAVKRGECEHIVFAVWDEPGFGIENTK